MLEPGRCKQPLANAFVLKNGGSVAPYLTFFVMRLPRLLVLGGLAIVLIVAVTVATTVVFRAKPMALSIGVHEYICPTDQVFAILVLTNAAAIPLAVPLRFRCEAETSSGITNFVADTAYTIFLRPQEKTTLSGMKYAVPLPLDAHRWKVRLRIRPQTPRERCVNALLRSGIRNPRFLSRIGGRARIDAEFNWTESTSAVFDVTRGPVGR